MPISYASGFYSDEVNKFLSDTNRFEATERFTAATRAELLTVIAHGQAIIRSLIELTPERASAGAQEDFTHVEDGRLRGVILELRQNIADAARKIATTNEDDGM